MIATMVVNDLSDEYLSTVEAAAKLGCRRETVFRLVQAGEIPGSKVANRWLIPRTALEEFAKTYEARRGPRRKHTLKRRRHK